MSRLIFKHKYYLPLHGQCPSLPSHQHETSSTAPCEFAPPKNTKAHEQLMEQTNLKDKFSQQEVLPE